MRHPFSGECKVSACVSAISFQPVKEIVTEAACDSFAATAGQSYVAAAATQAGRYPYSKILNRVMKEKLRPRFGNLVDTVAIHFRATPLDKFSFFGKTYSSGSLAQTFGSDIYINLNEYQTTTDLIAHEMTHTQQWVADSRNLLAFGVDYMRKWCKAGFSYEENPLEKAAFAVETEYGELSLIPTTAIDDPAPAPPPIETSDLESTDTTLPAAPPSPRPSQPTVSQPVGEENYPEAGSTVVLVSRYSQKCLDVKDNSLVNGGLLQQWDCNNNDAQKFHIVTKDNGYVSLVGVSSGRCASAEAANKANGTQVLQWECHDGADQKVRLIPNDKGSYTVHFAHSDKCMDVQGTTKDNGALIIQFDCTGKDDQDWIIKDADNSTEWSSHPSSSAGSSGEWTESVELGGIYTLTSRYSSKCLDVKDQSTANGGLLQQWDCGNGSQQKFRVVDEGNGFVSLVGQQSARCVSAEASNKANGTRILQWECHGGDDQKVRLVPTDKGSYTVHFSHSNKCMDVQGTTKENGALLIQFDCTGNDDQDWILKRAQ
ncbi:MAG: RICIN domain-containing protein [Oligoflexus sp.]|nr:RICIN domain-containing protein [Oligoflexus sp.]